MEHRKFVKASPKSITFRASDEKIIDLRKDKHLVRFDKTVTIFNFITLKKQPMLLAHEQKEICE